MPLSRFGRRKKHTFGKQKEEWDGDFRKPPKPDSYYVQEKGICRWCGKKIIENKNNVNRRLVLNKFFKKLNNFLNTFSPFIFL